MRVAAAPEETQILRGVKNAVAGEEELTLRNNVTLSKFARFAITQ
jgi:hypothetical protein